MTSKHKPPTPAAKKRPAAKTAKATAEKSVAHAATAREKDSRPKTAAAPRKAAAAAAEPVVVAAPAPHPPVAAVAAPVASEPATKPTAAEGKNGSAKAAASVPDKKAALGIERRTQAITEDRQS